MKRTRGNEEEGKMRDRTLSGGRRGGKEAGKAGRKEEEETRWYARDAGDERGDR